MKQKHHLHQLVVALAAGLLFGLGLAVSGMTRPAKVIGFLDPFGRWDPSLSLVMVGAIGVHLLAYRWVKRRSSPFLAPSFAVPTRRDLDLKLLGGAALFGVGWGLGGFCPGPSLTSLVTGAPDVLVFVATLLAGSYGAARVDALLSRQARQRQERERENVPDRAQSAA